MRYQYRSLMRGLVLAVAMTLLSLGTKWSPIHDAFIPVTPMAGVAVAGLFLWGFQILPWVVAGSIVGQVLYTPDLSTQALAALLVGNEDDAATLEMLSRSLSDRGATVITCQRGLEALHEIQSQKPDLIISDIGRPDMDGYELTRQVRRITDGERHSPAIALTAFSRSEDKNEALRAGFTRISQNP